MSERAAALADELQRVIDEVDQFVDDVSDEGWQAISPGEQWTVAALVCHIANANTAMLENIIKPVAEDLPRTTFALDQIHHWNGEAAQQHAAASREHARDLLRTGSAPAITYVRNLSDKQLATSFDLTWRPEPITLDAMIEHGLTGHPREHLASARAAAGMTD